MKKIICLLFGHKPTCGLFETSELISNKGCKRCGTTLVSTGWYWKAVRFCPPPGNTNLSKWQEFCDKEERRLRGLYYKPEDIGKRAIAYTQKQAGSIVSVRPHETDKLQSCDYVTIDTGLTLHRHYFFIEGERNIMGRLFEEHKHEFFK